MKIDPTAVAEALSLRVYEGDHLVATAIDHYTKGCRSKKMVLEWADQNRKHYAKQGQYLQALIHDQIYRLHGGED